MTTAEGPGEPRILASALTAFAAQGYHGTSIRDIAAGSGLSVPGLYHHYSSKQDVLMALVVAVMRDLLGRTRAALESVGEASPVARLDAVVEALLRFHLERQAEAFVASSEIRSLVEENRTAYVALRDEQQRMLADLIAAGVATGDLDVADVDETARAVAVLCVGVATWYRPDGPRTADEIVDSHLVLVRRLVGA